MAGLEQQGVIFGRVAVVRRGASAGHRDALAATATGGEFTTKDFKSLEESVAKCLLILRAWLGREPQPETA